MNDVGYSWTLHIGFHDLPGSRSAKKKRKISSHSEANGVSIMFCIPASPILASGWLPPQA